ncbi:hypothetical protein [Halosegnis longus]|uniref:Uncharacterized protein n=1 Tax=Halosegnis longus TaxID=2216012 RepID=A0AAJ4R6Y0_9EURY|nr:hypothetical protein Nmn1133_01380 [Salella cibi]
MSNVKSTDADTVDGQHADEIGRSDGQIESVINNDADHGATASHDYRTADEEAAVALAHQVVLGGGL